MTDIEMYTSSINEQIEALLQENTGNVSDGYHTFNELYDFRAALTNALFRMIHREWLNPYPGKGVINPVWKSKLHDDGTMFKDSFIVGAYGLPEFQPGSLIDFHYPISMWDDFYYAEEREKAPPYDGHSLTDVLERLKEFAKMKF